MSLEGQRLGRYQLLRVLGMGGMGEVYLADDSVIHRQVAIKVIRDEASSYPNPTASQESARLFQREMKAIAMLDHPHILPLYDYGEEVVNGVKLSFLVMPYRSEGSLATWLQQRAGAGMLTLQDVAYMVNQAADALQHAHDHQIIHQDVKTANFLLRFKKDDRDHPDLLLADFGVSKFSSATANVSQSIRGTPAAMAPEQWEGHPVPATDQYALAVMAYELLTGRPPFQGGLSQMMYQHFHVAPPPPSAFNPRLPSDIDDVLLLALAKKPEARFATVAAFARAFGQAALSNVPTMAGEFVPGSPPTPAFLPSPATPKLPGDSFVVLAISPTEARSGGSRTLTFPGGRQLTVSVPAGAYDGQIISLQDHGEPGGPPITLNLKLSIQQAVADGTAGSAEQTMRASNPDLRPPINPPSQPGLGQWPIVPPAGFEPSRIPPPGGTVGAFSSTTDVRGVASSPVEPASRRSSPSKLRVALLAALALVLVLGSIGIFTLVHNNQVVSANADATATAQAHTRATALAVNATGTAEANAINTQIAFNNNLLTATAQAGENMLTATATAYQNLLTNSTRGTPALSDPLSDNSLGNNWEVGTYNPGGACQFSGGAYHASLSVVNYLQPCVGTSTDFSNFAFQVQMRIVKGDCGGVVFRANYLNSQFYYLRICQPNSYDLYNYLNGSKNQTKTLTFGSSTALSPANQVNLITVIVKGKTIVFYINQHEIDTADDNTYSHGQIGFAADSVNNAVDVAFSNLKVWTL